ncbi:response regulator [Pseudomonas sp. ML96]|uniref:response regulator n=1 Tax=Pseudomonas sp. ML96 TaxID=1523503 RepID=UPI0005B95637|nr:response regulator [Pseudomonas sp. ML96]
MSRVLIADGHPVTRHAVRLLLEGQGHQVVGEAQDGGDAVRLALELAPDLLILDIELSRLNGLDVMARLHARGVKVPMLGFSSQDSEHIAGRFLQAGAAGFVSKHDDLQELSLAVSTLLRGRSYFPSQLLGSVNLPELREGEAQRVAHLSNRELSVLYFLASGLNNHAIAQELTISEKTVSTYRTRLQQKLNLHTLPDLIDFARRNQLVVGQGAQPATPAVPVDDEQHALLQAMIDGVPAALYVRDTGGRLLYANAAFLRLYEVELEAVRGTRAIDVDWYAPADAATLQGFFLQAIAAAKPFARDIEVRIRGRRRILHHWGTPYRDASGNLLGMVCGSADITERQDQLQAVRAAKEQAELGNRKKLDFLVSASHEFGLPLQALCGMLDMVLGRAELNEADDEALHFAASTARDLLQLVAELQGIARVEDGQDRVQCQATRLDELVGAVVQGLHAEAESRGLELQLRIAESAQQPVLTDPVRLGEALRHLLLHALRNTVAGRVRLGVQAQPDGERIAVRLEISGSPREQADPLRIYSLAELAEETARQMERNSPVGLTIARRLVEMLQGELVTASPPERGVTLSVHLLLEPA